MALWRRGRAAIDKAGGIGLAGWLRVRLVMAPLLVVAAIPASAEDRLELGLPLVCEPHKTCFIQSYNDDDPGPGAKDFACGPATYEKHNGIDFRLLSAEAAKANVPVVAAADGKIKAIRDGMVDVFLRNSKAEDIKGRECGNGVVVDHGNGWETQYCHMLNGSIALSRAQEVHRGDKLGAVGYSGMADFAHLHFTVRHNGEIVDPFAPDGVKTPCELDPKDFGLWKPSAIAPFRYRNGEIFQTAFTSSPPNFDKLEENHLGFEPLTADSPALIFFARFLNLMEGDRIRIVINGPGGTLVEQLSEPIERNKATYFTYAGKKRREAPWQQGQYDARAEIIREGAVAGAAVDKYEIKPAAGR